MNLKQQIKFNKVQLQPVKPSISFMAWLQQGKENKVLLSLSVVLLILPFIWLKLQYPFPNFIPPDSHSYIEAAMYNQTINIWPIGYSKFLQLIGLFSHSHFVLVLIQYLLLYMSMLYLLFIVRYYFIPSKWAFRLLLLACLLNPLLPQISNFVSSDCLFISLSVLWFTQLIVLINAPNLWLLAIHGLVIVLAITVRHNALYYPFVSLLLLFFTQWTASNKWISTAFIIAPVLTWMGYNQLQYEKETGKVQYSAFAGWQIASNALYGYAYADSLPVKKIESKYRKLHTLVNQHLDSLRSLKKRPDEEVYIYYLWNDKAPLRQFLYKYYPPDSTHNFFKRWTAMGPFYASYGRYLIQQRPSAFIKHYLWANFKNYYSPPAKFMGLYNLGSNKVPRGVTNWFRWNENTLPASSPRIIVANYFATLFPMINLAFAGSFIAIVYMLGLRNSIGYGHGIFWWSGFIWFCNMAFSIFSAPIELRFQLFPMTFTLLFTVLQFDLLLRLGKVASAKISEPGTNTTAETSNMSIAFNHSSK